MSLFRGKNILKRFFKRPKINWSNYEFESSLQLNEFVDQLLEPIKNSQSSYLIKLGLHEALVNAVKHGNKFCLLYTSPSPRDRTRSRMPSSA